MAEKMDDSMRSVLAQAAMKSLAVEMKNQYEQIDAMIATPAPIAMIHESVLDAARMEVRFRIDAVCGMMDAMFLGLDTESVALKAVEHIKQVLRGPLIIDEIGEQKPEEKPG